MPQISVIVPVYNKEKYLEKSLQSVLSQSFQDLEVIAVNDGSTDQSLKILKEIQKKDSRLRVIDIPNGGVSHARNVGIDVSIGKYITFADADDRLHPSYLENLVQLIEDNEVDLVISGVRKYWAESKKYQDMVSSNQGRYSIDKVLPNFAEEQKRCGIYGTCVAKIFSRQILDDIRFDETIKLAEDFDFYVKLYQKIQTVFFDKHTYYYYLQEAENSSVQIKDEDIDYLSQLKINLRYREFLKNKQEYRGKNREIIDQLLSSYLFCSLYYCPAHLLISRGKALLMDYQAEPYAINANGIREKIVFYMFQKSHFCSLKLFLSSFRSLRKIMRRE